MKLCGSCGANQLDQWPSCPFCKAVHTPARSPIAPVTPSVMATGAPSGPSLATAPGDAPAFAEAAFEPPAVDIDATPAFTDAEPPIQLAEESRLSDAVAFADAEPGQNRAGQTEFGDVGEPAKAPLPATDLVESLHAEHEAHHPEERELTDSELIDQVEAEQLAAAEASDEGSSRKKLLLLAVLVAVVGFVGWTLVSGGGSQPDVAFIDGTTTTLGAGAPATDAADTPLSGAVLGDEIASQVAGICAGTTASIPGAEAPTVGGGNDIVIAMSGPPDNDWSASPSQQIAAPVPALVRCVETADADRLFFCDDYEDGYTYAGFASRWTARLVQTVDGAVIGTAEGVNEVVADCPMVMTVYDDNKDVVERAGPDLAQVEALGAELAG